MNLSYVVSIDDVNSSVYNILQKHFSVSTRLYQKLIKLSAISINGSVYIAKKLVTLNIGDVINVDLSSAEDNSNIVPIKMNLDIIFEDDWLLIVNKPAGIPIHPSALHFNDSLSNGIRYYFDTIGLKKQIRPVNRLDFNTSGLVIFAKCEYVHSILSSEMQNGTFVKKYLAIIEGQLDKKTGTINLPIARKENSIIERCVSSLGQTAITHYVVLQENTNYSLVECILETGRTHQIRVHMSAIGHPILGDSLYGDYSDLLIGQALHSCYLEFEHPITRKELTFNCKPSWNISFV